MSSTLVPIVLLLISFSSTIGRNIEFTTETYKIEFVILGVDGKPLPAERTVTVAQRLTVRLEYCEYDSCEFEEEGDVRELMNVPVSLENGRFSVDVQRVELQKGDKIIHHHFEVTVNGESDDYFAYFVVNRDQKDEYVGKVPLRTYKESFDDYTKEIWHVDKKDIS
uniref:Uncharacterized protein n=1 Tax=Romanomermis culicivorax TaxID=13658 RepID=A0A915I605_ROMCU